MKSFGMFMGLALLVGSGVCGYKSVILAVLASNLTEQICSFTGILVASTGTLLGVSLLITGAIDWEAYK